MSVEPERPIEKSLREYAERRRREAGEPLALHPATRRMLQGEAARVYGRTGKEPRRPSVLQNLWPRLAWVTFAVAAVALIASVWLPGTGDTRQQSPGLLALNKGNKDAGVPLQPASPQHLERSLDSDSFTLTESMGEPAVTREKVVLDQTPVRPTEDRTAPLAAVSPPAAAPAESPRTEAVHRYGLAPSAAAPSSAPIILSRSDPTARPPERRSEAPASSAIAESRPAEPLRAPPTGSLAFSNAAATNTAYYAQNLSLANQARLRLLYNNQAQPTPVISESASAKKSRTAPAAPVLASFHLEQEGDEVRIEDRDGSIYVGNLRPVTTALPATVPARTRVTRSSDQPGLRSIPAADASPAVTPPQAFSFQVVGTNRSLNQEVVFEGTMVAPPQPVQLQAGAPAESQPLTANQQLFQNQQTPAEQRKWLQNQQQLLQNNIFLNRRISGKAVVGGSQEIRVEAVPAEP